MLILKVGTVASSIVTVSAELSASPTLTPVLAANLTELVAAVDIFRRLLLQLRYLLFRISRASSHFFLLHHIGIRFGRISNKGTMDLPSFVAPFVSSSASLPPPSSCTRPPLAFLVPPRQLPSVRLLDAECAWFTSSSTWLPFYDFALVCFCRVTSLYWE